LNASYVNAHYVDAVTGPVGKNAVVQPVPSLNAGDKFNIPPFTMSYGTQFNFTLPAADVKSYVRLDGTYQRHYDAGATFGSSGYIGNFFTRHNPTRSLLNLRGGVVLDNGLDVSVFVQNLLDKDTQIAGFGDGRGCTPPAGQAATVNCSNYGSYSPFVERLYEQPRRYGLQVNYKF